MTQKLQILLLMLEADVLTRLWSNRRGNKKMMMNNLEFYFFEQRHTHLLFKAKSIAHKS